MSTDLLLQILIFSVSLFALVKASDWFVSSAENIGLALGVSPFIIGVTLVAFGTSLPELASSIAAVLAGSSEIVVANVVGSNITNILLVLGLTVFVGREIKFDFDVMDSDMPQLIASAFLLYFVVMDGHVSTFECIILLTALAIFLKSSLSSAKDSENEAPRSKVALKDVFLLLAGGALVYLGATYTIFAIQKISVMMSVPESIIAVTGVALGTSLPEVVVSITAARKGNAGMAVGNVLGSNIFNTYIVMGIPGLLGALKIPSDILSFHLLLMIGVTILFALMCLSKRISRWEGAILILFYVFFLVMSVDL